MTIQQRLWGDIVFRHAMSTPSSLISRRVARPVAFLQRSTLRRGSCGGSGDGRSSCNISAFLMLRVLAVVFLHLRCVGGSTGLGYPRPPLRDRVYRGAARTSKGSLSAVQAERAIAGLRWSPVASGAALSQVTAFALPEDMPRLPASLGMLRQSCTVSSFSTAVLQVVRATGVGLYCSRVLYGI